MFLKDVTGKPMVDSHRGCGSDGGIGLTVAYFRKIGLDFTRKVAESMLKKGYYPAKGLESKRTGKKYDAKIRLVENGGKYPGFEMEFVNKKKRGKER